MYINNSVDWFTAVLPFFGVVGLGSLLGNYGLLWTDFAGHGNIKGGVPVLGT